MYAAAILQIACADAMQLTVTLICCQHEMSLMTSLIAL